MLTALIFGLFGLIIGSFLNVVILRRGARSIGGRSSCMHCGHVLTALDLVPVFSYVFLRGRCRYCGGRISAQYPLVEASTSISFALIGGAPLSLPLQLLALPIAALFICITVYDARHTVIPDEWVYSVAFLALIFGSLYSGTPVQNLIAGVGAAAPFALLWLLSHGRWMGLGDSKLALAIGALVGPWGAYLAITAAFVGGAAFFLPLVFFSSPLWSRIKRKVTPTVRSSGSAAGLTMRSEVPFGPFLIVSCSLIWILQLYGAPILTLWS